MLWVATRVDGEDVRRTDRSDLGCIVALLLDGCPLRITFLGRRLEEIVMILSCYITSEQESIFSQYGFYIRAQNNLVNNPKKRRKKLNQE